MKACFSNGLARAKDNITVEGEEKIVKTIENEYNSYLNHIAELRPVYKSNLAENGNFLSRNHSPIL